MKVLMFGWEYPPFNSGGLGVACLGLSEALAEKGVHVSFVLPQTIPVASPNGVSFIFADDILPRDKSRTITAYPQGMEFDINGKKKTFYGNGLIEEVMYYRRAGREIAKEYSSHDIIHAHDWLSYGAGISAKEILHKPLFSHIHATEFDRTGGMSLNEDVYDLEREGFEKGDVVVSVSNYTKKIVMDGYGIPDEKIAVVHNGVLPEDVPSEELLNLSQLKREGKKIVLFLGRLTLQKGPDYFLRAAEKIAARDPEKKIIFLIAGGGDMMPQLVRDTVSKGISDRVFFLGFLRDKEHASVVAASDVYVMSSVSEPFGIVPLEVLRRNVPVIIPKQSGVSEILSHVLKIDFWDVNELVNKIMAVLAHPVLKDALAENGSREAWQATWGRSADRLITLYESQLLLPQYKIT
jgi:glycosyltransferase involved in cell wall biosynthesis